MRDQRRSGDVDKLVRLLQFRAVGAATALDLGEAPEKGDAALSATKR